MGEGRSVVWQVGEGERVKCVIDKLAGVGGVAGSKEKGEERGGWRRNWRWK